jgi:hypothetical protein
MELPEISLAHLRAGRKLVRPAATTRPFASTWPYCEIASVWWTGRVSEHARKQRVTEKGEPIPCLYAERGATTWHRLWTASIRAPASRSAHVFADRAAWR